MHEGKARVSLNKVYDGEQLLKEKLKLQNENESNEMKKHCRGCFKHYQSQKKWISCKCEEYRLCSDCKSDYELLAELATHACHGEPKQTVKFI